MKRQKALTLALELAIIAPSEADKAKAVAVADSIAAKMPVDEVERCKASALLAAGSQN